MRRTSTAWLVRVAALVVAALVALVAQPVLADCAPSAQGIFPASGIVGTTVSATVPGSGLTGATPSVFGEAGLTVSVVNSSDTQISLTLTIDAAAVPGERIISFSTSSGVVAVDFTVNGAGGPIVDSVAPTAVAVQGVPLDLEITGQNLAAVGLTELSVSGTGVTVSAATPAGDGLSLDVTLDVAADALPGTRALVIAAPLGGAVLQIYVRRPPPVITTVSPGAGAVGSTVPLTITGANLTGASLIVTSGAGAAGGVTVSAIATPDDATLTATLTIAGTLTPESEPRLLILTTESGQVTTEYFIVAADVPSLTDISPAAGSPGATVPVRLKGLHLTGATLSTASASLTLQNVAVVDDETVDLEVVVAAGATVNTNHTITATVGTMTANATFRVITSGAPFIGAVRPPFGNRGDTMRLTLRGVNLGTVVPGTGVAISGSKIQVSNAIALDDTAAQAILDIDVTASVGYRDITVTTAGGSNTRSASFRVNIPGQVPTITDVTPYQVDPGTTTTIVVTGTNLFGAGVTVGGAGATVTNIVNSLDGTTVTFDLTLALDASAEVRPLIVVTENGTATCGIINSAEIALRAPQLVRTGSVFEVTSGGFRLFLFEFSVNDRFDEGVRTFTVSSDGPLLTLTRLQNEGVARAVRDMGFGYVRARAVTATNLIGTSQAHRFRR